jgi:hypothetical protein
MIWWTWIKETASQYKLYLIIAGFIVIIAIAVGTYNCLKPQPKLNEAEIQQASQAIEAHNDAKLKEILGASDARVQQSDANINAAEANTAAAQNSHNYDGLTHDQLAEEIEKRAKQ